MEVIKNMESLVELLNKKGYNFDSNLIECNLFRFKSFNKQKDSEALYTLRKRLVQIIEENFPLSSKQGGILYNRRELLNFINNSSNPFEKALFQGCFDIIETIDWPSGWKKV